MKLLEIFKKKKKTAVGNGEPHDASPPTPTPTPLSKPPPDHSICKRPESYFLALALPPLHTSSLPKYPTRRIESQLTKIQPPVDKILTLLSRVVLHHHAEIQTPLVTILCHHKTEGIALMHWILAPPEVQDVVTPYDHNRNA